LEERSINLKLRIIALRMAFIFVFFSAVNTSAAAGESALSALAALPAEERANLARIEGPDGNPRPERWYIDFFTTDTETGVREYVVAGHQIVARRELSQFASELAAGDVLESR
jgi:hypothetical protein